MGETLDLRKRNETAQKLLRQSYEALTDYITDDHLQDLNDSYSYFQAARAQLDNMQTDFERWRDSENDRKAQR